MSKIKKFTGLSIRTITGGKDPVKLIDDFIIRQGLSIIEVDKPEKFDLARWLVSIEEERELEILIENMGQINFTTLYMGVNIIDVPIRGCFDMLVSALELADGLIGTKVSLVNNVLVLSSSMGTAGISIDEIEYNYKLIVAQSKWFKETLYKDLDLELES